MLESGLKIVITMIISRAATSVNLNFRKTVHSFLPYGVAKKAFCDFFSLIFISNILDNI